MTNSEKKSRLNQFRILNRRIDQTKLELARWEEIATKITPQYSDMPKAHKAGDKVQNAVVEMVRLKEQLEQQQSDALMQQSQIKEWINSLQDDRFRDLLWYHYICGLAWKEVAEKMHFDLHYTYFLHKQALKALQP